MCSGAGPVQSSSSSGTPAPARYSCGCARVGDLRRNQALANHDDDRKDKRRSASATF